ncbi:MAG: thiosulfate oxidation carrier complex protein SoxZ [Hyphomicrobium sp.]|nr:thiosulfate oxidation carrier complex protein SoxZ [Hyphomicrobium sp.]PPD07582.1 MAG: thiosulfate oxidation carrier complex protein SoxZ [Hyphomicrobium sp.]
MASKTRIKLPEKTAVGDVIEIRALINHVMETGNRKDANGQVIPRDIVNSLTVTFGKVTVFKAEFGPGISSNPFVAFHMRVPGPGELVFVWQDDAGVQTIERAPLLVG